MVTDTPPVEPPTTADILAWNTEEQGDLPAEHANLPVEEVRTLIADGAAAATQAAREAAATAQRAEQQRLVQQREVDARSQTDIDYYNGMQERLRSVDPEVATAATAEMVKNQERYDGGAAALRQQTQAAAQASALRDFFGGMSRDLAAAGMPGVIPDVADAAGWAALDLAKFDGKGGVGAYLIEQGRALERAAVAEQVARAQTATDNAGASGPPLTPGATVPPDNYGNQAWCDKQMAADSEWPFKMSPDGKTSNNARMRQAVLQRS